MNRRPFLALCAAAAALLVSCAREPEAGSAALAEQPDETEAPVRLANPASTHCVKAGGRLAIEKLPSGAEYGLCLFEDNRQCEEWALLRGDCPLGGRRITGYATAAGRYCAITGGTYTVVAGDTGSEERGHCDLPGGKSCDADDYYQGNC